MKRSRQATIPIVPGLRDHVEDHWQTHLERRLSMASRYQRVMKRKVQGVQCQA